MTSVHITADRHFWTGDSTLALLSALQSADSVVVSNGDGDLRRRFEEHHLHVEPCGMSGPFAPLNLARAMRRLPPGPLKINVHSPRVADKVKRALQLLGRPDPVELVTSPPRPDFPVHKPQPPSADSEPLFMWLGNITDTCGLGPLLELMATHAHRKWRLRIVGHGKGRTVGPLLRRVKALDIDSRIEWTGYQSDPYKCMDGVTAGIVTGPQGLNSVAANEFAAASLHILTHEDFDNKWPEPQSFGQA